MHSVIIFEGITLNYFQTSSTTFLFPDDAIPYIVINFNITCR